MKHLYYTIILLVLSSTIMLAQPANDPCSAAISLGTPSLNTQVCDNGTTVGATPEFPYPFLASCNNDPAGTTSPAADVWYTLTTPDSTNSLDVDITSAMSSLNVAVYTGGCGTLSGVECATSTTGNYTGTISNLSPGTVIYIQVSGGSVNDVGAFNLCVTPAQITGTCALSYTLTSSPSPINNTYAPGDVITFCYTLVEYDVLSANWFHSIVLEIGAGWDMSTLTPISSAATCDGSGGTWGYYTSVTSDNTGITYGPGFYFDGDNDGNPGNDYGDNCTLGNWQFCWQIAVQNTANPATQSTDLTMGAQPYGDSQTGSWTSSNCATDSVNTVNVSLALCSASMDIVDASCSAACDGEVAVVPNGQYPFTYTWSNGATDSFFVNACVGTYNVTIVDDNSCVAYATAVVSSSGSILSDMDSTNITCNGASDGKAWVTPTSGTGPYTYTWSTTPAQLTDTAFNLAVGQYTVTITDQAGCSGTNVVNITEPTALLVRLRADSVSCFGGTDGSIRASVNNGTTPYTYSWNSTPVQNTVDAANLPADNYILLVTDAAGCTATANADVFEPAPVLVNTFSDSVNCNGGADGRAWVSFTGGQAPFTYNWNSTPAQNTDTATGLSAGIYDVTVTDFNTCQYLGTVQVFETSAISLVGFSDSVTCSGSANGRAWIEATGGVTPYTYNWSAGTPIGNGDTITGVTAGNYTVTVTDANGCADTATINVLQLSNLNMVSGNDSVTCNGGFDGKAWVSASGGAGSFTYQWSTSPVQVGDTAYNLRPGFYSVTATDLNGCQDTAQVFINEPAEILLTIDSDSVSCFGAADGKAWVTASGGVGALNISWSGGTPSGPNGDTISGLGIGVYVVTVSDFNGCIKMDSIEIFEPIQLLATATTDSVSCNAGADGMAWLTVTGGAAPFTYAWSAGTPTNATGDTVSGLIAGTYTATVTDANQCSVTVTGIVIEEPTALLLTEVHDSVSCNGGADGSIDITLTGGTAPYTFAWSNGSTAEDLTNLTAGVYTPTCVDANGCSVTIPAITIGEPTALALVMDAASSTCNGANDGGAWATPSGGTAPYTYAWNTTPVQNTDTAFGLNSGTYTVTVTDANNCTITDDITVTLPPAITFTTGADSVSCNAGTDGRAWATGAGGAGSFSYLWNTTPAQNTDTASGLAAGQYEVTITDLNGCFQVTTVDVEEPAAYTLASTVTNVSCNAADDGAVDITVSGSNAPYTFAWGTASMGYNTIVTEDLNSAAPDTYFVEITDSKGCLDSITNLVITEPAAIVLSAVVDSVQCNGGNTGAIDLTVAGGTTAYQYAWSNTFNGEDPGGLVQGTYTVTVTDANGCVDSLTTNVDEASGIVLTYDTTGVSCFGGSDGAIDITVNGGATPYLFDWSNTDTSEDIVGLIEGTYTVTVTDDAGCQLIERFIPIDQPDSLYNGIELDTDSISCDASNQLSGLVTQTSGGGVLPYTYLWNTGETTVNSTDFTVDSFYVTLTDANGCTVTSNTILNPYEPYTASIVVDSASCYGDTDGEALVNLNGGTGPFVFSWSGLSDQGPRVLGLDAGDYFVEVADAYGCDTTIFFTVTEQPEMSVELDDSITVAYALDTTLVPVYLGTRATDSILYTWTPNDSLSCTDCPEPTVTPVRDLMYYVEMNVNGCVYGDSILVLVNDLERPFYAPNAFSPNGDFVNDYFELYGSGIKNVVFMVFDRWGEKVFEGRDMADRWDGTIKGKPGQQGIYVLHVFVQFKDGASKRFSQSLTLVR